MDHQLAKRGIRLTVGLLSGVASAQTKPEDTSYLNDQRGTVAGRTPKV